MTCSPARWTFAVALAVPLACGDDGVDSGNTMPMTDTVTATAPTTPGTSDTTTGTIPTTGSEPTVGSMSVGETSGTDPSSSTTNVDPTDDTTTSNTTSTTNTTETTTGEDCVCTPGATDGCTDDGLLTCKDDCSGFEPVPCPNGQNCVMDACSALLCAPGQFVCEGLDQIKQCNPEGDGFEPPVACGMTQQCSVGQCTELCDLILGDPSSVGCVFRGNKVQNFIEEPSAITVGNVSKTLTAAVTMYYYENGGEQVVSGPLNVPPGQSAQFNLLKPPQPGTGSILRPDTTFKVVSNVPVVAYLHSPITAEAHNDSSMLLPDHAQQRNYIIPAYKPNIGGNPAYFNVVGLKDGTEVTWQPPVATLGSGTVPAVAANAIGQITIGDYDMLQVSAGQNDISGTIISLSEPAWVLGAVQCVNIPVGVTFCDHIQEQAIPLEYWGLAYVGAHAPKRNNESYVWRVYGGEDGITVSTTPAQPGFPVQLNKGQFYEFSTKDSLIFTGTGPFMPVQYLVGQNGGAGTGDPAMYQMVPVEQFLDRYVFVTGIGYNLHYAQIVRTKGGPDVLVDGVVVAGYYDLGDYQVADWSISEGTHLAESDAPFGIYQVGYTNVTSYAYPGGLRLKVINPQ